MRVDLRGERLRPNVHGRDKELSPLTSQTLHLAASYGFLKDGWHFIDRGSINFSVDLLTGDYHEFTNLRTVAAIGEEPLYALDADIVQLFFSFWY